MRFASFVLILVGGVLPLLGLFLAAWRAWKRMDELDEELTDLLEIARESGPDAPPTRADRLRARSSIEPIGVLAVGNFPVHVAELAVVRDAVASLRGPAALVGVGTVCGTVGGILALYA